MNTVIRFYVAIVYVRAQIVAGSKVAGIRINIVTPRARCNDSSGIGVSVVVDDAI